MIWGMVPVAALLGYLLGAIPVGVLVCRLFGVDIRSVGSGRTGTTNAWRAAGLKAAVPTLIGDSIKGAVAVWLVRFLITTLFPDPGVMDVAEASARVTALQLASALAGGLAIIGHNWSVFLGFKGGAGGITSAATTMAIHPMVGSMVWLIGGVLIWWTRMASVATFSVGLSAFAIFLILYVNELSPWPYVIYGAIALVSVYLALRVNRANIKESKERIITLW